MKKVSNGSNQIRVSPMIASNNVRVNSHLSHFNTYNEKTNTHV